MGSERSTTVSKMIRAPREAVYAAFLDPWAVSKWLPPGSMRGIVHDFEPHEGGRFSMSLVYADADAQGKTSADADTFEGRFSRLVPDELVVWATEFQSDDPGFAGEMTVSSVLKTVPGGTVVTMTCENIPSGIRLEDNEVGCSITLEQMARFVEG
ncbi:SRPBCC family protein [Rhizobium sp. S152]|uniref:SRPBCC family protein n=1 Tax=Rhizobium sp. S152 TaxID=3055038 RepID=UPI0025A9D1AF|nr:SRPBCC family protein [Rhizobium sp. S152]MDM9628087.1 SRPBCC family protein [Rhizobium sp. S152]